MGEDGISQDDFAELMRRLAVPLGERVAVAVSGGPDSMALAFCLKRYVKAIIQEAVGQSPSPCGRVEKSSPVGDGFFGEGFVPRSTEDPSPKLRSATSTLPQGEGEVVHSFSVTKLDSGLNFLSPQASKRKFLRKDERGAITRPAESTRNGSNTYPLALIVEHGLRDESADEAAAVAARLEALGIETRILPWVHGAVDSRVHVRARDARYGLLLQACREAGIRHLFLAHHAGDQAETILMRFAKGSGIDGLAGMALATSMGDVTLWRPLLEVPKARLEATCAAAGIAFVTDPSNEKDKYARGRLRRLGPLLEEEGFTVERLLDLGARAREAKDALDHYACLLLREGAERLAGGAFRLDLIALRGVPRAVALRALAMLLLALHQGPYAPRRIHLVALLSWLLDQDEGDTRSLHGCLVQKGELCVKALFLREPSACAESVPLVAQETVLWDGRWHVTYCGGEGGLEVRALGAQRHEDLDLFAPALRKTVPQGRVRACLPTLWRGGELVCVPSFSSHSQGVAFAVPVRAPWE